VAKLYVHSFLVNNVNQIINATCLNVRAWVLTAIKVFDLLDNALTGCVLIYDALNLLDLGILSAAIMANLAVAFLVL